MCLTPGFTGATTPRVVLVSPRFIFLLLGVGVTSAARLATGAASIGSLKLRCARLDCPGHLAAPGSVRLPVARCAPETPCSRASAPSPRAASEKPGMVNRTKRTDTRKAATAIKPERLLTLLARWTTVCTIDSLLNSSLYTYKNANNRACCQGPLPAKATGLVVDREFRPMATGSTPFPAPGRRAPGSRAPCIQPACAAGCLRRYLRAAR